VATWCTAAWPDGAAKAFPANLVSPGRLAQVLGFGATITFGLVFAAWSRSNPPSRWPVALIAGTAAFFLTAMGGSAFRELNLPTYRTPHIAAVSIIVAVVIVVAMLAARRNWALIPLVIAAIPVVAVANPIQRGFADFQHGAAASIVQREGARMDSNEIWANDDLYFDALLMANGQRSLSGQQWVGPERDAWEVLDPEGDDVEDWNRGTAYVSFDWIDDDGDVDIQVPSPDMITVAIDPCSAEMRTFRVARIVSVRALENSCLDLVEQFEFGGQDRWIYKTG
jgi:hypothetical protein